MRRNRTDQARTDQARMSRARMSRARAAVGRFLRALGRYTCLSPAPARRSQHFLRDRYYSLTVLALIAFSTLGWAYSDLHGDSARIQYRTAPALVELAKARVALEQAQWEAGVSLGKGTGNAPPYAALVGLGEDYQDLISTAGGSLNQVAGTGALRPAEAQDLRVVSGLVLGYEGWIRWADDHRDNHELRNAALSYAASMLCDPTGKQHDGCETATVGSPQGDGTPETEGTAILSRIAVLESGLRADLDSRKDPGAAAVAAACVSAVAFALLVLGLVRTHLFLRHRFRLRVSLPLTVAALPLLALPLLAYGSVQAHAGQREVWRTAVEGLAVITPGTEAAWKAGGPRAGDPLKAIERARRDMEASMEAHHTAGWARLSGWTPPVGVVSAALMGGTLHAYRRDYLSPVRPEAS